MGFATTFMLAASLCATGGEFTYAMDDAYIHLAIAKNLADYGLWGVNRFAESSASSSPLWIFILSFFGLFMDRGTLVHVPFTLNFIFQAAALFFASGTLERIGADEKKSGIHLVLAAAAAGFPALTFVGMEHSLQIALCVMLLNATIDHADSGSRESAIRLSLVSALLLFARYDSVFIIASCAIVLLFNKRFFAAAAAPLAAMAPVFVFGALSVAGGHYFVPTPIVRKMISSVTHHNSTLFSFLAGTNAFYNMKTDPGIFALIAACLAALIFAAKRFGKSTGPVNLLAACLGAALLHVFGSELSGGLFRYSAYIVFVCVIALSGAPEGLMTTAARLHSLKRTAVVAFAAAVSLCLAWRALQVTGIPVFATKNIRQQQMQIALYLRDNMAGRGVAANDIGAISYFSDVRLLDLVGLASDEITELNRDHAFSADRVFSLIKRDGVELAVVYENWFKYLELPVRGIRVAEWEIGNNKICSSEKVSFFCLDKKRLSEHLRTIEDFSKNKLPKDVSWKIFK